MTEEHNLQPVTLLCKWLAYIMVSSVFLYLFNNYLVFWLELPGPYQLFSHLGWFSLEPDQVLDDEKVSQAWLQIIGYFAVLVFASLFALLVSRLSLHEESERFGAFAAYLVRSAFWAVLLIGLVDMMISFLRIEGFLQIWFSDELITQLGRPAFRGESVHYPLLVLAFVIGFLVRKISFSWLALLVVLAEFQIVLTRFVFSYEQAFMGDLVRFWYAALFLFASAYTLLNEGHVRVDVLYAGFGRVKKAWSNILGTWLLGIPLCWVILMQGMGGRGNSINSPLLSYEISQSAYGMYVKYLMAGFLIVFSVTMLVQFVSYFLKNVSELVAPSQLDDELTFDPEHSSHQPEQAGH